MKNSPLIILDDTHDILHAISKPIEKITPEIISLTKQMFQIVDDEGVAGLAAPQVGVGVRLIVCKYFIDNDRYTIIEMLNPVINFFSHQLQEYEEGCLSVPKVFEYIQRSARIKIQFLSLDGKPFNLEAKGYNAQIIQHEIDHLNGILFTDRWKEMQLTGGKNIFSKKK